VGEAARELLRARHPRLLARRLRARDRPGPPAEPALPRWPGTGCRQSLPRRPRPWRVRRHARRRRGRDITLCRSAWAGSQRYGAAVWSGDIDVTFETLRAQIAAGLNIGLSGIPWWTTDIGGFHGGDPEDPEYRELLIRWFQYAVWCPLFRLHGHREPRTHLGSAVTGGPNEVWSYGEEAYAIIVKLLALRERMRPYILEQMRVASEHGTPPMRPLWFDDPEDEAAWTVEDEFCFGPDILVAPITELAARQRTVYVPRRSDWRDPGTGTRLSGGNWHDVEAPLEWTPVLVREGVDLDLGSLCS
jgi:alpha-D-xyloside xylohydrolase